MIILSKTIYCAKCEGEIKRRDDLVTSTLVFEVIPYHEDCYARDLKGATTFYLANQPLNGFSWNVVFLLSVIFALWILLAENVFKELLLLAIIPIGYRMYSYFFYERHLKR